jgi:hypothetical protein
LTDLIENQPTYLRGAFSAEIFVEDFEEDFGSRMMGKAVPYGFCDINFVTKFCDRRCDKIMSQNLSKNWNL